MLTFDDGPIPEVTPKILAILREKQVHATFFVVGDNVRKHPELLQAIVAEGHGVGNHTFHHLRGLKTSTEDYLQDVAACQSLINHHVSFIPHQSSFFRPPHGRMRFSQKRALRKMGYEIVLWDVLTHDYNPRYDKEKMLKIVDRYVRDGSIIVFHDSLRSNERMLDTLPAAIDLLRAKGYSFV